jgi:pyridoxine kinase
LGPQPGAVIVISSHVVRGSVGNRAAVFALESLGLNVWAVPTIILPWHPGHGRSTAIIPDTNRFSALVGDLESAPWLSSVTAIISGYLGSGEQALSIAGLVRKLRDMNPGAFYLCDPVIGDSGRLYVAQQTAEAIRDQLIPLADLITPNLSEFQWLTDTTVVRPDEIRAAAAKLSPREIVVTSASGRIPGNIGNLYLSERKALLASHPALDDPPKGAGDLFAALFVGNRMLGAGPTESLKRSTSSVYQIISETKQNGNDELELAKYSRIFTAPTLEVDTAVLKMGVT